MTIAIAGALFGAIAWFLVWARPRCPRCVVGRASLLPRSWGGHLWLECGECGLVWRRRP